jgi:hypothetical protein
MISGFEAGVGFFAALVLCGAILANVEVVLGVAFVAAVALAWWLDIGREIIMVGTAAASLLALMLLAVWCKDAYSSAARQDKARRTAFYRARGYWPNH